MKNLKLSLQVAITLGVYYLIMEFVVMKIIYRVPIQIGFFSSSLFVFSYLNIDSKDILYSDVYLSISTEKVSKYRLNYLFWLKPLSEIKERKEKQE
jgi:hypothetical protein